MINSLIKWSADDRNDRSESVHCLSSPLAHQPATVVSSPDRDHPQCHPSTSSPLAAVSEPVVFTVRCLGPARLITTSFARSMSGLRTIHICLQQQKQQRSTGIVCGISSATSIRTRRTANVPKNAARRTLAATRPTAQPFDWSLRRPITAQNGLISVTAWFV